MTDLERMKLESMRKQIGNMTSAEALTLATDADTFCRDLSPFDPAFNLFNGQRHGFLEYAELLEKEENSK